MCSLFKKSQRGWLKNSLNEERSNRNFTRDSLFGNDVTIDEMKVNQDKSDDVDEELGSGLRQQHLKKKKYKKKTAPKKKKPKKSPKKQRNKKKMLTIAKKKPKKKPKKKLSKKFNKKMVKDIFSQYL